MTNNGFCIECTVCGARVDTAEPLDALQFRLSHTTVCPCGSAHATLPSAKENVLLLPVIFAERSPRELSARALSWPDCDRDGLD